MIKERLRFGSEVAAALADRRPIVALESTLISHGLPYPANVEVARASEAAVRGTGAVPATVAIHEGEILVDLGYATTPLQLLTMLLLLALYKIRALLDGDLRLRTACDLSVVNRNGSITAEAPEGFVLPPLTELEAALPEQIRACGSRMAEGTSGRPGVTTVTYKG